MRGEDVCSLDKLNATILALPETRVRRPCPRRPRALQEHGASTALIISHARSRVSRSRRGASRGMTYVRRVCGGSSQTAGSGLSIAFGSVGARCTTGAVQSARSSTLVAHVGMRRWVTIQGGRHLRDSPLMNLSGFLLRRSVVKALTAVVTNGVWVQCRNS